VYEAPTRNLATVLAAKYDIQDTFSSSDHSSLSIRSSSAVVDENQNYERLTLGLISLLDSKEKTVTSGCSESLTNN
jgi:hypothetical protein